MQEWSTFLKELKNKGIEEERRAYLDTLSLIVKDNVYQQGHEILNPEKGDLILDTIKLQNIPISII